MSGAKQRRDPLLGASIDGRYLVTERVGAGGMATVYSAIQLKVDRPVAIKVLGTGSAQDDDLIQRFQNEARVIGRLRHPNVLKLHDVGSLEDGRLYIVTELLHGAPLDRLVRARALTAQQIVRLMQPVTEALAEAHAVGVIHRDLKPANLYLERAGDVEILKVLDFGIAKLGGEVRVTASGSIFGTPRYMSPEQAEARELDGRSDIYSLGVVLFECFSGRAPFEGESPAKLLIQHVSEPPPPLAEVAARELPPELEALVDQMLSKDRDQRPPTMIAVRDRLRAIDEAWRRGDVLTPPRALPPSDAARVSVAPAGGRLLAGPDAALAAGLARDPRPSAGLAPTSSRVATRRLHWLPMGVAVAGVLALGTVILAGERRSTLAPVPLVSATPRAPSPTPSPAVAAVLSVATPTVARIAAPPVPPRPSSSLPSRRRATSSSAAPVPAGFEDVDYRELGAP